MILVVNRWLPTVSITENWEEWLRRVDNYECSKYSVLMWDCWHVVLNGVVAATSVENSDQILWMWHHNPLHCTLHFSVALGGADLTTIVYCWFILSHFVLVVERPWQLWLARWVLFSSAYVSDNIWRCCFWYISWRRTWRATTDNDEEFMRLRSKHYIWKRDVRAPPRKRFQS
jgi:hypothetical protein